MPISMLIGFVFNLMGMVAFPCLIVRVRLQAGR